MSSPQLVAQVTWVAEWDALKDMHDFVERFLGRRFPTETADRARIVTEELLENAVRFAVAGSHVVLEVRDLGSAAEVRVTNEAVESRIAHLRRRLAEAEAGHDSGAVYRRAVEKLMNETGERATGGLGLLRIRHEADVQLRLEVTGRTVTVVALVENAAIRRELDTQRIKRTPHGQLR